MPTDPEATYGTRYVSPAHKTIARLIYQTWQHRMVEIGEGRSLYAWEHMPPGVRRAWVESVGTVLHDLDVRRVRHMASELNVSNDELSSSWDHPL